eukprot:351208-Chlamydomonas_euryale.AAC.1
MRAGQGFKSPVKIKQMRRCHALLVFWFDAGQRPAALLPSLTIGRDVRHGQGAGAELRGIEFQARGSCLEASGQLPWRQKMYSKLRTKLDSCLFFQKAFSKLKDFGKLQFS